MLICTFNRASLLDGTLASLAAMRVAADRHPWDVLVVDNNSADATKDVVAAWQPQFPVALRYLSEPRQGKSYALNTGLEATAARFVAFTDDDVRVSEGWLDAAIKPMLEDPSIEYTGGPVHPIWGAPPPAWLSSERGDLWGAIATLNYGCEPFVFEERQRVPLGANMAVSRGLIHRAGGFHPMLGRTGSSLLGQEQAEFFMRTRALGARGLYVPGMAVEHHVPAGRLSRRYFRRWWFWKGVSQARLHEIHPRTELGLDLRTVPRIAGVPRYMFGSGIRHVASCVSHLVRGNAVDAAREEMLLMYVAGYVWARWSGRGSVRPAGRQGRASRDLPQPPAP